LVVVFLGEIRLVERDIRLFREVGRWRVVLGRHITALAGFEGQRACQRRLKKLIEAGFLERKKVLYGVPGIYSLTHKAKLLASLPERPESVRVEQIPHDIAVLDTAIFLHRTKSIAFKDMVTEKQLHQQDGFGTRKHRPDFVFTANGKTYCIEVELSLKAKSRLEKNILDNFMAYDFQIWIVPDTQCKIHQILKDNQEKYPNIRLLEVQEVQKNESFIKHRPAG
jgi:hypothetical protein